jgi:hypothetical protein
MTIGSPYAHSLMLQHSAYVWKAEQNHDDLVRAVEELTEAHGQVTSSQELADRLDIDRRLVQALLRNFTSAGYLKQLGKESGGGVHVMPTKKLRRSVSSEAEG